MPKRVLKNDAMPDVFPHLNQNAQIPYDEAVKLRKTVETILDDHGYFDHVEKEKIDLVENTVVFDVVDSTMEVEVESVNNELHEKSLENENLKLLLEKRIKKIESLEEEKRILEEEKANGLLPRDLFTKIFGDDQIKFLQNGRVHKWSTETIRKALKLRYACGTRGIFSFCCLDLF